MFPYAPLPTNHTHIDRAIVNRLPFFSFVPRFSFFFTRYYGSTFVPLQQMVDQAIIRLQVEDGGSCALHTFCCKLLPQSDIHHRVHHEVRGKEVFWLTLLLCLCVLDETVSRMQTHARTHTHTRLSGARSLQMLDVAILQIGVGVFHAWLFRGGADGWVSKVFVSTDTRRPNPRGVIGSTVGTYPRGTSSNPVEGNGHFFPLHRQLYLSSFSDSLRPTQRRSLQMLDVAVPQIGVFMHGCFAVELTGECLKCLFRLTRGGLTLVV